MPKTCGLARYWCRGLLPLLAGAACSGATPVPQFDPAAPTRSGYRLAFASDFDNPLEVAVTAGSATARWYRTRFFGGGASRGQVSIADGLLTLGGLTAEGAQVQTATPVPSAEGWAGRVFRGGGYFEARFRLGPDPGFVRHDWPAFWAMAVEHMGQRGGEQWPGQPDGFTRFIETDFFELNKGWLQRPGYAAAIHDWYGIWRKTCAPSAFCQVNNQGSGGPNSYRVYLPAEVDWSKFHTVGQLVRPARKGKPGLLVNYFDGREVGERLSWDGEDGSGAPPRGRQAFNTLDRQGLVLMLTGGERRMDVDYVRVWQDAGGSVEVAR